MYHFLITIYLHLASFYATKYQRWSPRGRSWPRGHKLKYLTLASKVKSLALASKPASPRKFPVLGSRIAIFFDLVKMGQGHDKFCFVLKSAREPAKFFLTTFRAKTFFLFLLRPLPLCVLGLEHSCPWPRKGLHSERLSLASDFFCVLGLGLEPCVLDSTSAKYF